MKCLRFVMVGGFLGAGKTTAISRLAHHYQNQGLKVGIVTNDQAQDLVDTLLLRSQGFSVEEVAGACFCCRFDDLVTRLGELEEKNRPDILLAEPVGSCTDLVATVVQPLRDLFQMRFEVAPYPVLFKPAHGLKILENQPSTGFSPKAAYIFLKQLEEADAIILNRMDELTPSQVDRLQALVEDRFPGTPVLRFSARTGQGIEHLVAFLDQQGPFGRKVLNIDYDVYAEGEAELGWLNATFSVQSNGPMNLDQFLLDLIQRLQQQLAGQGAEIAHLKVIGLGDTSFAVANAVSNQLIDNVSLKSEARVPSFDLIVNARVGIDPEILENLVRAVVPEMASSHHQAEATLQGVQSFRPGRPVPTHRYDVAKA